MCITISSLSAVSASATNDTAYGQSFKIGLLIPRTGFESLYRYETNFGAALMAIENIENKKILPKNTLK